MTKGKYHFFVWHPRMTRPGAYLFFGVRRNSYAARIVDRIYDYYLSGAQNLRLYYWRFYRKEFATYQEFLSKRFNLFDNEVAHLSSLLACYKDLSYEPDVHLTQLLEDSTFSGALTAYFRGEHSED